MNLELILKNIKVKEYHGDKNRNKFIKGISDNSLNVKSGYLFFAVKGNVVDGHNFIIDAINNGCKVIVCTELPSFLDKKVTYIIVENIRESISTISSNFYKNPSKEIKIICVTGTNGKTSIVYFLHQFFSHLNIKVGMLSTIENVIDDEVLETNLTTPSSILINKLLRKMVSNNCDYCIMEASSHAIDQERVKGLKIDVSILTNLTHDHLDYHKTFLNYINAKKKLFDDLSKSSIAIINSDDKRSDYMVQNCKAKIFRYGIKSNADFKGRIVSNDISGLSIDIDSKIVHFSLIGEFNAYNILAIYSVVNSLNFKRETVLKTLSLLKPPKGRFEIFRGNKNIIGIVDYAHTPDALLNVLRTINKFKKGRRIITIVGAGGDRDKMKRPLMGKIASEYSDFVILTSDNPRFEDEMTIINEIKVGIKNKIKYKIIVNRKEAIHYACDNCDNDEIILLAGKGHEKYQIINDSFFDFNERKILEEKLNKI